MTRVMRHLFVLLLLVTVGGGTALGWLWLQSDEILREELLKQVDEHLHGATLTLGRAHFDLSGRVRVYDLVVKLPGESRAALTIPETVITLDRQRFADNQQIIVQHVQINQPQVRVIRNAANEFAWQRVRWVTDEPIHPLPEITIAHGRVDLFTAGAAGAPPVVLPIEDLQIRARPASRGSYSVQLAARSDLTGEVQLDVLLPLEPAAWKLNGEAQALRVDPSTTELATILIPSFLPRVDAARAAIADNLPPSLPVPKTKPQMSRFDLGLTAVAKVKFQLASSESDQLPQYRIESQLQTGRLTHPALPFPLSELQGGITFDRTQILVQGLQGLYGDRRVTLNARREPNGRTAGVVQVDRVPIDDALITRLPPTLKRHVTALALTGRVSGTAKFSSPDGQRWIVDADAALSEGTVRHEKFPLLVQQVTAKVGWHDNMVQIDGEGRVGVYTVRATGTLHNPGPVGDADFHVQADDFSLDDEIVRACPPAMQKTIAALRLAGRGSARMRVQRPAGLDQKYQIRVWAAATRASLAYEGFPYPITDLTGEVNWLGDTVTFENLRGRHNEAELFGSGSYTGLQSQGRLLLSVTAKQAEFDRALHAALPVAVRETWDALSPQGLFSLRTEIDWQPGSTLQVTIPQMTVHRGEIELRDFKFPWRDVRAELDYADSRVTIREFSAQHDSLQIGGQGRALCLPDRPWQVIFDKFRVDDLTLSPALRRELPQALRPMIDSLNPQGRFSGMGQVAFFGPTQPGGSIGAAWKDLTVQLTGCSLNAGLQATDIYGNATLSGQFDGVEAKLNGELNLDSLTVLGNHQITKIKGPLRYENGQLEIGSAAMTVPPRGGEIPNVTHSQRVSGHAYGGELTLDAYLDLRREPLYRAHLELASARLEDYALRHLRGQGNVRGLMTGWMDIHGRGLTFDGIGGEGRLQISPAALYELPVFLQIFQLPQFQPIDRTAFNYADFFFTLANQRFDFQLIDLVGKAITLRGRGYIRFDGQLNLNFFTMLPKNRTPLIGNVVDLLGVLGTGWIAVEVYGPIAAPVAEVVPFPAVDAALKQFLGAFEPRPMGPPPPIVRSPQRNTARQ